MLTTEQRDVIVKEAQSWIGTRYVGWSAIKGPRGGVDCGQLLYAVLRDTGHVPANVKLPTDYSLQISQHQASTAYIDIVRTYMREVPESEVLPGDVVIYKLGKAFAHGAFIIKWPDMVLHAIAHNGVTCAHGSKMPVFKRAEKLFFTLREEFCNSKELD
jgi:cell wall-associated NlpC family hydrolase